MKTIISRQNPEILAVAHLKEKKHRDAQQRFVAEGLRTCLTLLACPSMQLITLYATHEGYQQLCHEDWHGSVTLVSPEVMHKMSSASTPSGILSVFALPQAPDITSLQSGIVLANINDPGNAGTLIRSCAAFGLSWVVAIDGVDVWHPKVIQASAGTHGYVHIITTTWDILMQKKPSSLDCIALVAHGGTPLQHYTGDKNALLVIGNEAHGIPAAWEQQCTHKATIDMPGKTESLNAAVAGSIALYELFGR